MKLFEQLSVKQKQKLRIALVVIGIILLAMLITSGLSRLKEKKTSEMPSPKKKASILTEKVEKDLWIAAEGQNIKALEKSNEEIRAELDALKKQLEETKKEKDKKAVTPLQYPPVPPPISGAETSVPPGGTLLPRTAPGTVQPPPATTPQTKTTTPVKPAERGSSIRIFKDDAKVETKKEDTKDKKEADKEAWLPSGSFMKAVLLNGIDAPTSGGSQAEPYPVLLGITDLSVLPNRFKMNLKECFVIGAGYGNISDERAYIRTEGLSCVRNDGKVIDISLKGHIIGEDGKLGLRGRLVSKQGQQIAMAIFSGTLSGLGQALKPQQSVAINLRPNASGGVIQPQFGDVMESVVTGGVGSALGKVADHYLKMAEKIFPIVEIDAGRSVEIIVLKGQALKIGKGG